MDEKKRNIISENLVKIREYMGYSKQKLANLLDLDEKLIDQWESGEVEPTVSQVLLLSRLYDVSVDDIFGNYKVIENLQEGKREEFNRNARLNRIVNQRYCC